MKKILLPVVLAMLGTSMFTSCSNDESLAVDKVNNYKENFEKVFGQVSPAQNFNTLKTVTIESSVANAQGNYTLRVYDGVPTRKGASLVGKFENLNASGTSTVKVDVSKSAKNIYCVADDGVSRKLTSSAVPASGRLTAKFETADGAPTEETTDEVSSVTVAFEDLGSTDDFDFNDAVVNVNYATGTGVANVTLMAVGAVLPLKLYYIDVTGERQPLFDGQELHKVMGYEPKTIINTNWKTKNGITGANNVEFVTTEIKVPEDFVIGEDGAPFVLEVNGTEGQRKITASTEYGAIPQVLVVGKFHSDDEAKTFFYRWPKERVSINLAFPTVSDWMTDPTNLTFLAAGAESNLYDGYDPTVVDEQPTVEANVLDLTDPQKSGIEIVSVVSDGTMTIRTTEAELPHVGDYLCSGPTEIAPYGYLLRVTEITKLESSEVSTRGVIDDIETGIWLIKTTGAVLNEVFANLDLDIPISLTDVSIDEVKDNEGNVISMSEEEKKNWKIPIPSLKADLLTLTPEISFSPKKLTLHLHVADHNLKTFGIEFDTEMETKVKLDATIKNKKPIEKTFDLYHVFLKPIPIPGTPIVITPLFQVYLSVTANAKAVFSFVPIHEIYDVNIGAQYNGETNSIEPVSGEDFIDVSERNADKEWGVDNMETSFTLDGNLKASLGASLSFGLYGCNYVGRVSFFKGKFDMFSDLLSADFRIDVNRESKAKVGISFNDMESNLNNTDFRFTDQCSWTNYFQAHAQFYARIYNPITHKFMGYDPEIKTREFEFWPETLFPSLFVTDFKDFQITPENSYIKLSANKYRPLFGYSMFKEVGLGFRYATCESDGRVTGDWKDIDLLSNYNAGYPDLFKYTMETNIPMNSLEKDRYYFVCPYVRVDVPQNSLLPPLSDSYYIHRKGRIFKLTNDGSIVDNELPNIPGFDL